MEKSFFERAGLVEEVEETEEVDDIGEAEEIEEVEDRRSGNNSPRRLFFSLLEIVLGLVVITAVSFLVSIHRTAGSYECVVFQDSVSAEDMDLSGLTSLFSSMIKLNLDKDLTGALTTPGSIVRVKWVPDTIITVGKLNLTYEDGTTFTSEYKYSGGVLDFAMTQDDVSIYLGFRKVH